MGNVSAPSTNLTQETMGISLAKRRQRQQLIRESESESERESDEFRIRMIEIIQPHEPSYSTIQSRPLSSYDSTIQSIPLSSYDDQLTVASINATNIVAQMASSLLKFLLKNRVLIL